MYLKQEVTCVQGKYFCQIAGERREVRLFSVHAAFSRESEKSLYENIFTMPGDFFITCGILKVVF